MSMSSNERLVVDLHLDGVCKPVLVRDERADGLCEDRRKHVDRVIRQVDRVGPLDRLLPHRGGVGVT